MLRLTDIMTTDVITVSSELALRDAMSLFVTKHISGAPVVEGSRVVGVVSLSDLVTFAAALPGMPPGVEAIGDHEETGDQDENDELPASFFTDMWDDAGAGTMARAASSSAPEWNAFDEHTVEEAMNRSVCSLPPDADVPRAAEYMQGLGVHRVLVMEDDRLLGIVTTTDISRAVAKHQLSARRFVFGKPQTRPDGSWW